MIVGVKVTAERLPGGHPLNLLRRHIRCLRACEKKTCPIEQYLLSLHIQHKHIQATEKCTGDKKKYVYLKWVNTRCAYVLVSKQRICPKKAVSLFFFWNSSIMISKRFISISPLLLKGFTKFFQMSLIWY